MFRAVMVAMIGIAAIVHALSFAANARPLPRLLVILDASSSMEDELSGALKYKLVRRAIAKALPPYAGRLQAGLLAFGRNDRNSCKDVSRIIPLKILKPEPFSLVINNIKPKGKSSIGSALVDAVNMVPPPASPLHILLIADGADNCGNDVCATASLIARHSAKIRVHVIGLGKTGSVKRLSCISDATKGLYSQVTNESEMARALDLVLKIAVSADGQGLETADRTEPENATQPAAPPPLPARKPAAKIAALNKAKAKKARDSLPAPRATAQPAAEPARETAGETAREAAKARQEKKASPEELIDNIAASINVPAPDPTPTPAPAPAPARPSGGSGKPEKPVNTARLAPPAETPAVSPAGETAPVLPNTPVAPRPLPVTPHQQPAPPPAAAAQPATPFLGDRPSIEVELPRTVAPVKLAALITEDGKQIRNGLIWRIYDTKKGENGRYKLIKSAKSPLFRDTLPLGVYLVNLSWGRSHLTEKMDILSSKPFQRNFVLNAGGLRLAARHIDGSPLPANMVTYRIYSDERDQFGKRRLILDKAPPGKTIRLNAGIYHISSLYGTANGMIETDITVEAGKLADVKINHTASKVTFKLVNQPNGEALAGAVWRITSPDGKLIKEAGGALPTLVLAAGDYTVQAQYSGRTFARKVTIERGQTVHVEIVIQ